MQTFFPSDKPTATKEKSLVQCQGCNSWTLKWGGISKNSLYQNTRIESGYWCKLWCFEYCLEFWKVSLKKGCWSVETPSQDPEA